MVASPGDSLAEESLMLSGLTDGKAGGVTLVGGGMAWVPSWARAGGLALGADGLLPGSDDPSQRVTIAAGLVVPP